MDVLQTGLGNRIPVKIERDSRSYTNFETIQKSLRFFFKGMLNTLLEIQTPSNMSEIADPTHFQDN